MDILIGYTGFVGSNLRMQHKFDRVFNSSNIAEAFGIKPDLCVYSGIRAEKFLANTNPKADMESIENAIENIKRINPERLVLISTIEVYDTPHECDENTIINEDELLPYGYNRRQLEKWCEANIENCHILRLPNLFGANLKKNFLYDMVHVIPSALNEAKYEEFSKKENIIGSCYIKQANGFYFLKTLDCAKRTELLEAFKHIGFSAMQFTDSRVVFQFYNLGYLWEHIKFAVTNKIPLLNLSVEPVLASELYQAICGEVFCNEIADKPLVYGFKTIYADRFGGAYIFNKQYVVNEIREFVTSEKAKLFA